MIILKPSKVQGVGCFTDKPIKKGKLADIWEPSDCKFVSYRNGKKNINMCETYCVSVKGGYSCPVDFRRMSVGWYLNHSDKPNLASSDGDNYYATKNIRKGEELTIDYSKLDSDIDNSI